MSDRGEFEKAYNSGDIHKISRDSEIVFEDFYKHVAWAAWQAARSGSAEAVKYICECEYGNKFPCNPCCEDFGYCSTEKVATPLTTGTGGVPVEWSNHRQSNDEIAYDHVIGETPFGRFEITWKGWKEYDSRTVDQTPWGDYAGAFESVDGAKDWCEKEYLKRIALSTTPGNGEWVRCADRLPTEADGDWDGQVIVLDDHGEMACTNWSVATRKIITHWMPTGLKRPQPPVQGGDESE